MKRPWFSNHIIAYEIAGWLAIVLIIWLDEIADFPHILLGAGKTPINWTECWFETLVISVVWVGIIAITNRLLNKIHHLQGFLAICSSCKKIKDEKGNWKPLESYIRDHSEAEFSHGICPECARKYYPGLVQ